jgi:Tfp pilus assembly protein FimT
VELLVVIAIIVVMMTLLIAAFPTIRGAGDLTKAAYDVSGVLSQARAYAMANNTYVWVGIQEVDASQNVGKRPQKSGTGAVVMAMIASKDGTRTYDPMSISGNTVLASGSTFMAMGKIQRFDNLHLAAAGVLNGNGVDTNPKDSTKVGTGGMMRPYLDDDGGASGPASDSWVIYDRGISGPVVTRFSWPLGSTFNSSDSQYNFSTVINFDPQGVARVQTKINKDSLGQYLELGLLQTHGAVVSGTSNVAALQVDCMSGANRIYRP